MWLLLSCPNLHVCWLFPSRLLPGRQLMSFGLKRDLVTHYICLMHRKASEGLPLGGWHKLDNTLIIKFTMKNVLCSAGREEIKPCFGFSLL